MIRTLVVSSEEERFSEFISALRLCDDLAVSIVPSGRAALLKIGEYDCDVIVADEQLSDMTGLGLVHEIVLANPMINCAVLSGLSSEDFHEASEGLGIICQLPVVLGEADAADFYKKVAAVVDLTAGTDDF